MGSKVYRFGFEFDHCKCKSVIFLIFWQLPEKLFFSDSILLQELLLILFILDSKGVCEHER